MTKKEIRAEILAKRKRIPAERMETGSAILRKRLLETDAYKKADSVYLYAALAGEVITQPLITLALCEGKRVAVPKVMGPEIRFFRIRSLDDLLPGAFRIPEPAAEEPAEDEHAFLLLPGIAFDEHRNRIGYGKGYYDRYLMKHPGHPTGALAYDFSVFPAVPHEDTDRKPDFLITEKRIYGDV